MRFGTAKCHLIWTTEYRYAVLGGDVDNRCRKLLRENGAGARDGRPRRVY